MTTNELKPKKIDLSESVTLIVDPKVNLVYFDLISPVAGSLHAPPGVAHYAEHLFFHKGKKYTRKVFNNLFDEIGDANAGTWYDAVCYNFCTTADNFKRGLEAVSDYLFSDKELSSESLEKEMDIINSEIKMYDANSVGAFIADTWSDILNRPNIILFDDKNPRWLKSVVDQLHKNTLAAYKCVVVCSPDAEKIVRKELTANTDLLNNGSAINSISKLEELQNSTKSGVKEENIVRFNKPLDQGTHCLFYNYNHHTIEQEFSNNFVYELMLIALGNHLFNDLREDQSLCYSVSVVENNVNLAPVNTKDFKYIFMQTSCDLQKCKDAVSKSVKNFFNKRNYLEEVEKCRTYKKYSILGFSGNPYRYVKRTANNPLIEDTWRFMSLNDKVKCLDEIRPIDFHQAFDRMRHDIIDLEKQDFSR